MTLSTYYNEREQPTEVYFLDSAGCQVSRVDLLYDEAGRLVEEAQTHSDEVLPSEMLTLFGGGGKFVQRTHRYNDQGRRMETSFGVGPLGGDVTTMAYNEYGDLIQKIHEREEREVGMDDRAGSPKSR